VKVSPGSQAARPRPGLQDPSSTTRVAAETSKHRNPESRPGLFDVAPLGTLLTIRNLFVTELYTQSSKKVVNYYSQIQNNYRKGQTKNKGEQLLEFTI